jgi:hypothetical protein
LIVIPRLELSEVGTALEDWKTVVVMLEGVDVLPLAITSAIAPPATAPPTIPNRPRLRLMFFS